MHDQPFLLFFVFFGSCFFTFILSFALFQLNASTKSLIKGNFSIYNISALCNSLTSITYYQVYSQHACFKCDSTYLFDLVLNRFQTDFSKIYIAQNNFSPSIFLITCMSNNTITAVLRPIFRSAFPSFLNSFQEHFISTFLQVQILSMQDVCLKNIVQTVG